MSDRYEVNFDDLSEWLEDCETQRMIGKQLAADLLNKKDRRIKELEAKLKEINPPSIWHDIDTNKDDSLPQEWEYELLLVLSSYKTVLFTCTSKPTMRQFESVKRWCYLKDILKLG